MPSDLLNDGVIEMAGVAHELLADLVGVLEAAEDVVESKGELATLAKLNALVLLGLVNLLDPALVVAGR